MSCRRADPHCLVVLVYFAVAVIVLSWVAAACGQGYIVEPWRPPQSSGWRPAGACCPPGGCPPDQPLTPARPPAPRAQSVRGCQASTVRVILEGAGRAANGNGTLIAVDDTRGPRRALVVSCGHILEADWRPFVVIGSTKYPASLLASDTAYDVAAFEVANAPRPIHVMQLADQPARPGQTVRWEGYVSSSKPDGEITGYRPLVNSGAVWGYKGALLRANGKSTNGQSGGPIYAVGGLQAVLTSGDNANGGWQVAGPSATWIRGWLAHNGIQVDGTDYTLAGAEKAGAEPIEPAEIPLPPLVDVKPDPVASEEPAIEPIAGDPAPNTPGPDQALAAILESLEEIGDGLENVTHNQSQLAGVQAVMSENQAALADGLERLRGIDQALTPDRLRGLLAEAVANLAPIAPAVPVATPGPSAPIVANPPIEKSGGRIPWGLLISAAAGAAGLGIPTWAIFAYRAARVARKLRRTASNHTATRPLNTETTVVVDAPPATERHHIATQYVNVESDHYQRAHAMAQQQIARRYPGAQEILAAELDMTRQYAAGISPN